MVESLFLKRLQDRRSSATSTSTSTSTSVSASRNIYSSKSLRGTRSTRPMIGSDPGLTTRRLHASTSHLQLRETLDMSVHSLDHYGGNGSFCNVNVNQNDTGFTLQGIKDAVQQQLQQDRLDATTASTTSTTTSTTCRVRRPKPTTKLAVPQSPSPARAKQKQRRQQARLYSSLTLTRLGSHTSTDEEGSIVSSASASTSGRPRSRNRIPRPHAAATATVTATATATATAARRTSTSSCSSFQLVAAASSSLATVAANGTATSTSTSTSTSRSTKSPRGKRAKKSCAAAVTHGMPKTITPATLKAQSHKPLRRATRRRTIATSTTTTTSTCNEKQPQQLQRAIPRVSLLFARDNDHVPLRRNRTNDNHEDQQDDGVQTWYPGYQPPKLSVDKRSKYKAMLLGTTAKPDDNHDDNDNDNDNEKKRNKTKEQTPTQTPTPTQTRTRTPTASFVTINQETVPLPQSGHAHECNEQPPPRQDSSLLIMGMEQQQQQQAQQQANDSCRDLGKDRGHVVLVLADNQAIDRSMVDTANDTANVQGCPAKPQQVVKTREHPHVNHAQQPKESVINNEPFVTSTNGNWLLLEDASDMQDDDGDDDDMDTSSNSRHNFLRNQIRYGAMAVETSTPIIDDLLMNASFATVDTIPTANKLGGTNNKQLGANDTAAFDDWEEIVETSPCGENTTSGAHKSTDVLVESVENREYGPEWMNVNLLPFSEPDDTEAVGRMGTAEGQGDAVTTSEMSDDADKDNGSFTAAFAAAASSDPYSSPHMERMLEKEDSHRTGEINTDLTVRTTCTVHADCTAGATERRKLELEASVGVDAIARTLVVARGGSNSMDDSTENGQHDDCNEQSDVCVTLEVEGKEVEIGFFRESGKAEQMIVVAGTGLVEAETPCGALEVLNKTPIAAASSAETMTCLIPDPSLEASEKVATDMEIVVHDDVISIAKEPNGIVGSGAPADTTVVSHHDDYINGASQVFMPSPESKREATCSRLLDQDHLVQFTVTDSNAVIKSVLDGSHSTVSTAESAALIRKQSAILRQTEEKDATGGMTASYGKDSSRFGVGVGDNVTLRQACDTDDEKALEEKAKKWAKARRAKFGPSIYPAASNDRKSKDSASKAKKKKKKQGPTASEIPPTSFLGEVAAVMHAKSTKHEGSRTKKPRKDGEDSISATTKARERKASNVAKSGLFITSQRSENRTKSESLRRPSQPAKDPCRSPSLQNTSCTHDLSTIDSSSSRSKTPQRRPAYAAP